MKFLLNGAAALLLVIGVAAPVLAANAPSTNGSNASSSNPEQKSANDSKAGSAVTEPKGESEKMNGDAAAPAK